MPHIHDKIDFTVEVFIVSQGTILLHMHQKLGKWMSIGGHIELDEDPIEACHREVKEEMGIDIDLVSTSDAIDFSDGPRERGAPQFLNRNPITDEHEHITLVYFARPRTTELVPEDGVERWHWFTREELEQNSDDVPEDIRWYALKAIETLGD